MIVTVEEVPGLWAVRLTATGAVGTVTWYRAIGQRTVLIGTGASIVDRAAPLDTELRWVAVDNTDTAVTDPWTITSSHPVLSSSMYAGAYQVTVLTVAPEYEGQSVWHPVIDRDNGPIATVFPANYPSGTLRLDLPTDALRRDLLAMLHRGDPLILRSTCPAAVDDMTMLPLRWRTILRHEHEPAGPRVLEITWQALTDEAPAWVPNPTRTYQTVLNDHTTYQAVLDGYTTYQAVLDGLPA